MNALKKAYYILRYLGPRIVWLRAGVVLDRARGSTRKVFAPRPWETIDLSAVCGDAAPAEAEEYAAFKKDQAPAFLFPLGRPPAEVASLPEGAGRVPALVERLDLLRAMRCVYFFRDAADEEIRWHENPFDGGRSDPAKTWCEIPDYLPEQGDPRMMWEPSRAAWAIDLARARARGIADLSPGDDAAAVYWRWVDSWMGANPPFLGFQWKCGQESAVRFLAMAVGFWALADGPKTTAPRWVQLARLAWATGYRIAHHIRYAVSQKNNHAISEACGLLLISQLFPEFRQSPHWRALGRKVLAQELRRQIYDDGTYLQQSMNYHRVMLQGGVLALRLAETAGEPFERDLYDRLGRCGEFLFQMMDPRTGRVPQYGANDGAWILPLSECDFWDYRPVIQAAGYLATRQRPLPAGPWDEGLLWLFGREAVAGEQAAARQPTSAAFETGGYYTLRREDSWAMTRCHRYRDRPGHCDWLHVDLWWRGQNLLRDCGTYRYYIPGREDLEAYFPSSRAHNGVELDGADAAERVSRFLLFPWPESRKRHFRPDGPHPWWVCDFLGYDRPPWRVLWRRTVLAAAEGVWVIVDDLLGEGPREAAVRWHFADVPWELDTDAGEVRLSAEAGEAHVSVCSPEGPPDRFEMIRGRDEPGNVQGLASTYYGRREDILVLEAVFSGPLPRRIVTAIGLGHSPRPRLAEDSAAGQTWEFALQSGAVAVRLARPARFADNTVVDVGLPGPRAAEDS